MAQEKNFQQEFIETKRFPLLEGVKAAGFQINFQKNTDEYLNSNEEFKYNNVIIGDLTATCRLEHSSKLEEAFTKDFETFVNECSNYELVLGHYEDEDNERWRIHSTGEKKLSASFVTATAKSYAEKAKRMGL